MSLLEVGCGRGEFLKHFKKLGLDVYGVDISPEAPDYQRDISIQICDIEAKGLPFPDKSFDIIYSKSLIEHLNNPDVYVSETVRVLKPGGLLLTLVPDWESNYKIYFDDYTHRTPFSPVSLELLYRVGELEDINVFKLRQIPIVWKFPLLNNFCAVISPFIPVRTGIPFLKWSRELMLVGSGRKHAA